MSQALIQPSPAALRALNIRRLVTDSRQVKSGDTFIAYPGEQQDGRRFIPQAIANGAGSVLWERRGFRWRPAWRVANLGITNLRAQAGLIAAQVHDHPSTRLWMVGVTGTNGKTSCSQWVARALNATGTPAAVIGTLGYGVRGKLKPLVNTTPDAVWLHAQLDRFVRRGVQAASMEVSSIGLDQDRVAGVQFDVALLTNLTRDHLDYHRSMRAYRAAKAQLFACASLKYAILNLDDEFGRTLARDLRQTQRRELQIIGYGFGTAGGWRGARIVGSNLTADVHGVRFDVATPWGNARVVSTLIGRFNAANLLATLAVLLTCGLSLRQAVAALKKLTPVPGRMQTLGGGRRPLVVVDYAHTPDALQQVLKTLRELLTDESRIANRQSRLICVFGCGGERDRGKRPLMGAIATRLADRVVLTSDNPRAENPQKIISDILDGVRAIRQTLTVTADRRVAIRHAVAQARRGDIVLIAGKGHETYQEIKGVRRPFNDIEVARDALKRWAA
jgi:UDP-N-acetylmuramoyl-L-alanyl-D-glutamate--2,6-diaminopimelate ligase